MNDILSDTKIIQDDDTLNRNDQLNLERPIRALFGPLNQVVIDILRKRSISFEDFSYKLMKVYSEKAYEFDHHRLRRMRNSTVDAIFGRYHLGSKRFMFLMNDVLNEPIPDDPEIQQLLMIVPGKDLRGKRFGRLIVIKCLGSDPKAKENKWLCECDCGNKTIVRTGGLQSKTTQSCGCYAIDIRTENATTHGKAGTPEYKSWNAMMGRCYSPSTYGYNQYGGRGIEVFQRWRDNFLNFLEDMGPRPEGTSLDRINNDGQYCKENCRWATREQQDANKQNTLRFDDGTPVASWVNTNNLSKGRVWYYYNLGLHTQEELLERYHKGKAIEVS